MKVEHCRNCDGRGKHLNPDPTVYPQMNVVFDEKNGVKFYVDCEKCGGTGHIITE